MDWGNIIFWAVCISAAGFSISFGTVLAYGLRGKISFFSATRSGVAVHTNETQMWSEVVDQIDQTDSGTSRSIRKSTTGLMILDPHNHDISADIMLVNREANLPLIYAAYENHITRKLDAENGIEQYIADKVHDVKAVLQIWRKKFPDLTDELIEEYVYRWIKKAVIPNLRRACSEKLNYYRSQIDRDEMSTPLKTIIPINVCP